ncbi:ribosome-binding factor A [Symbiobacterium terraclitae]|uniref:Ribosome-binding factor A n=1 Tax=Symbiobacterium terraclitae TaxID=557451 RepID=A0ABS4JRN6_9FIRM|nr:30S ribosome-binding factor RbfA [Symbiobacterium terraclitae]MBP2017661.1 ribosome-binding factor A [Symbiobacterium terraclitae]
MAGNQRAVRVGDQMRDILAELLRDEVKDPRIGFVSIVRVEVSNDLRHAKIFVSVLGNEQQKKESMKGLASATGFLRSEVAKRLQLRYAPELHFELDESIEHGQRIAQLLVQVQDEQKRRAAEEGE